MQLTTLITFDKEEEQEILNKPTHPVFFLFKKKVFEKEK